MRVHCSLWCQCRSHVLKKESPAGNMEGLQTEAEVDTLEVVMGDALLAESPLLESQGVDALAAEMSQGVGTLVVDAPTAYMRRTFCAL